MSMCVPSSTCVGCYPCTRISSTWACIYVIDRLGFWHIPTDESWHGCLTPEAIGNILSSSTTACGADIPWTPCFEVLNKYDCREKFELVKRKIHCWRETVSDPLMIAAKLNVVDRIDCVSSAGLILIKKIISSNNEVHFDDSCFSLFFLYSWIYQHPQHRTLAMQPHALCLPKVPSYPGSSWLVTPDNQT